MVVERIVPTVSTTVVAVPTVPATITVEKVVVDAAVTVFDIYVVTRVGAVVAGVEDRCDSMVIFSSGALKSMVFPRGRV